MLKTKQRLAEARVPLFSGTSKSVTLLGLLFHVPISQQSRGLTIYEPLPCGWRVMSVSGSPPIFYTKDPKASDMSLPDYIPATALRRNPRLAFKVLYYVTGPPPALLKS